MELLPLHQKFGESARGKVEHATAIFPLVKKQESFFLVMLGLNLMFFFLFWKGDCNSLISGVNDD